MPKYKDYVQRMLNDHNDEFESFRKIHKLYAKDNEKWQNKFNEEGKKILEIVREYENKLCKNTERGMYNRFSSRLAEKFQNEIRKIFPLIDNIGIIIEPKPQKQKFYIKKINLST